MASDAERKEFETEPQDLEGITQGQIELAEEIGAAGFEEEEDPRPHPIPGATSDQAISHGETHIKDKTKVPKA